MFVMLTQAKKLTPVMVNLDQILYAYRHEAEEVTVIVFGQVPEPAGPNRPARLRNVAVAVTEKLPEIQQKRRMASD